MVYGYKTIRQILNGDFMLNVSLIMIIPIMSLLKIR